MTTESDYRKPPLEYCFEKQMECPFMFNGGCIRKSSEYKECAFKVE